MKQERCLILENFAAHVPVKGLKMIKSVVLHPNTVVKIQPYSQRITKCLKMPWGTREAHGEGWNVLKYEIAFILGGFKEWSEEIAEVEVMNDLLVEKTVKRGSF